jgi:hypothetical protein
MSKLSFRGKEVVKEMKETTQSVKNFFSAVTKPKQEIKAISSNKNYQKYVSGSNTDPPTKPTAATEATKNNDKKRPISLVGDEIATTPKKKTGNNQSNDNKKSSSSATKKKSTSKPTSTPPPKGQKSITSFFHKS